MLTCGGSLPGVAERSAGQQALSAQRAGAGRGGGGPPRDDWGLFDQTEDAGAGFQGNRDTPSRAAEAGNCEELGGTWRTGESEDR